MMKIKLDGIPYGDTFEVAVRWVARRHGDCDIVVEVGVELDFKKITLMKSKIRAGTIDETAIAHKDLFEAVKAACAAAIGEQAPEEEEREAAEEIVETVEAKRAAIGGFDQSTVITVAFGFLLVLVLVWILYAWASRGESHATAAVEDNYPVSFAALEAKIDKMQAELKAVQGTLDEILTLLKANKN